MGINTTPDKLRGFLIPVKSVDRGSIWEVESNFNQKNPRAGFAEAQQMGTGLEIITSGDQTQKVIINTQEGGLAGSGADFTWSDGVKDYGKNTNNLATHWERLRWSSGVGIFDHKHVDAAETQNGILYFVYEVIKSGNQHVIAIRKRDRSGVITLLKTFVLQTFIVPPNTEAHPAIEILADGSIVVCYFNYTQTNETNLTVQRSLDGGATWQKIATRALESNINIDPTSGYQIKDLRTARSVNTVTLWIELVSNSGTAKNRVAQYRSGNYALDFQLVGPISSNTDGQYHAIRPVSLPDGSIGCAYLSSTSGLSFRKIPNASIRLGSASYASQLKIIYGAGTWASTTGPELQNGDLSIIYADDNIFVYAREYNTGKFFGFVSSDMGDTWETISTNFPNFVTDGIVFNAGASAGQYSHTCAVTSEGRIALLGIANYSLDMICFGGYSTVGYPNSAENPTFREYAKFDSTYFPIVTPSTASFYTTTGTGAQSIITNGLDIQTNTTQRYYTYTGSFPANFLEGWIIKFRLNVITGSTTLNNYIAMDATQDDGVNSRNLNIRFTTTGFEIRDNAGILQAVTHDMTLDTEILIGWLGGNAIVSYRHVDNLASKSWTSHSVTVGTYATGAGDTLRWGHISTLALPLQTTWREFHISTGESAGINPYDMAIIPALYPSSGTYQYITGGMSITTKSSPARGEDSYNIVPAYDYPLDNAFPSVVLSPRIVWRSADATEQNIAWLIDIAVGSTVDSYHLNDVFGVYLGNINFRKAELQRWNGAAWTTIMDIDTSAGLTGTFNRGGHSLQSNVSATSFYLNHNEAVGWRAILTFGDDSHVVKIKQNTAGIWGKNTNSKRCILMIDTDLTNPAGLPTVGTIELLPNSVTVVIDALDDVNNGDSAIRLQIPAQDNLEGYYQIGALLYGVVVVIAPQYQRGRQISFNPNVAELTTNDGMYYARKMSNGSRNISIAWTEPITTTRIHDLDPNYWQLSNTAGAHPIANYGDAPLTMLGLAEELSNTESIVYLPYISQLDTQIMNRNMDHVYCRLEGGISIESVLGEEMESEAWRVATVNLSEIE